MAIVVTGPPHAMLKQTVVQEVGERTVDREAVLRREAHMWGKLWTEGAPELCPLTTAQQPKRSRGVCQSLSDT